MPISSPSYFPPQRSPDQVVGLNAGRDYTGQRAFLAGLNAGNNSTINDIYVIGDDAFSTGSADAVLGGTIAIGSNAAAALTVNGGSTNPTAAVVVIGNQALSSAFSCEATVVIGDRAMQNTQYANNTSNGQECVVIGALAAQNAGSADVGNGYIFWESVVIGYRAFQGNTNPVYCALLNSIVIGDSAVLANQARTYVLNTIVIGSQAAQGLGAQGVFQTENNVIIGCGGTLPDISGALQNVFVGGSQNGPGTTTQPQDCVSLGYQINIGQGQQSVLIGSQVSGIGGAGNVVIGYRAGNENNVPDDTLLIETYGRINPFGNSTLIYGAFNLGSIVLGNSSTGNREWGGSPPATNALKLLQGNLGTVAPTGGGYMLSWNATNDLIWVNSNGQFCNVGPSAFGVRSYARTTIASGYTGNLATNTQVNIFKAAATVATATLTLPAAPYDGQQVDIVCNQAITALTVNIGAIGQSLPNPPTYLTANLKVSLLWDLADTTWYRLQ